jgi:flagellar biosynthetic protein FliR
VLPASAGEALIRLGAGIFTVGFRLALPAVALLMLVDIALALVGRVHAQLQLLTISFPVKMLAAVAVLAWTLTLFPRLYVGYAGRAFGVLRELIR